MPTEDENVRRKRAVEVVQEELELNAVPNGALIARIAVEALIREGLDLGYSQA